MKLQKYFINEITLLQYYGSLLGITVDCTPKCYPELANEGIEYAWTIAKLYYRRMPLDKKRTKAGFKNLLMESLDPMKVLSLQSFFTQFKANENTVIVKVVVVQTGQPDFYSILI